MTVRSYTLTEPERQRVARIDELVVLGGSAAAELVAAVDDPSWTVRRAAVAGLAALGDEAVPALAAWLVTSRSSERAIAAVVDALVASIGPAATEAARELLASPRPEVAADGAVILGRRHAGDAAPALIAALGHGDDNVAVASIEALGALGPAGAPASAIEPLIAVVESRSFFRAFPALQVLARSGDPRAVRPIAALLDDPLFRGEAIRALGRTGSAFAIAPLAQLLGSGDRELARLVAGALADVIARAEWSGAAAHVGETVRAALAPAIDELIRALADAEATERAALVAVLGRSGDPRVLPVLAGLLDQPELHALDAIRHLGRIALLDALGDADPEVIAAILPAVTSTGDVERVRALVTDPDPEVRARACEALARLGDTASVPALFAALADRNPRVALAATGAIQALQTSETVTRAIEALGSGNPAVRRHVLRIVAYLGLAAAFDEIHAATADPDRRIAELAIAALGALDDPRADAALATLAAAPEPGLRAATMRALGHRDGDAAGKLLQDALADEDAWVRYYACQGLGHQQRTASASAVLARLADAAPHVRIAAVEALARLDTPAAWQALVSAARSADPDEARAALVGIGQHPRDAAIPILVAAAHGEDLATRLIALSGLAAQPGAEPLQELQLAAASSEPTQREAAVSLLAEREDPAASAALVEIALATELDHPVHRALSRPPRIPVIAEALRRADERAAVVLSAALARIPDPRATAALFHALATGEPVVRRAAASSLLAIAAEGADAAVARVAADDPDPDVRRFAAALAGG